MPMPIVLPVTSKLHVTSCLRNSTWSPFAGMTGLSQKTSVWMIAGAAMLTFSFMAKALVGRGWWNFHATQEVSFAAHIGEGA